MIILMNRSISSILENVPVRKLIYGTLLTLPVVIYIFKISLLYRHGLFLGEDWDYFAQSYEAARQSILHYHQFPWWNPWMNGGQPLFANPQFGLFSLHMPLVLLFGTVTGLHLSLFVYYILGFWGMFFLLRRLGSGGTIFTSLLSYVWLFSSYGAWHLGGGQFTFTVYLLAPWAFLAILNIHKRHGWLWFGLIASLLIQTAAHYITIEALFICGLIAAVQLGRVVYQRHIRDWRTAWPLLEPYLLAGVIVLLLCGVRLFYTFQFMHEYPRLEPLDSPESPKLFIGSIVFRHAVDPSALTAPHIAPYGWAEYADYFGLITIALLCYLLVRWFMNLRSITRQEWFILIASGLAALLTLGPFMPLSPFSLIHHLPLFSQMRVPSRFIGWAVLGAILLLLRLPRKPAIYVLLVLATVDVFTASYPVLNYHEPQYVAPASRSANQFEQYEFFDTHPELGQIAILGLQNLRLLRATQSNYGEVYAYEPILNIGEYYYLPGTNRCGVNHGCEFVLTNNATVTMWSPQEIILHRTGSGLIKLNMNPGKVWEVNGHKLFANYKVLELQRDFTINDPSQTITVRFSPGL